MKKLTDGISNYEKLIMDEYYYVDKTMYIEKLENINNPSIMFFRPRKFGKTLFTSVLENYYDVLKKDKFDMLFKDTYIGKNPTKNKNRYYILHFNFSGIDTETMDYNVNLSKKQIEEIEILALIKENLSADEMKMLCNKLLDKSEELAGVFSKQKISKILEDLKNGVKEYKYSIIGSMLNVLGTGCLLVSFNYTYASIASPLTAIYTPFVLIYSFVVLKEKMNKVNLVGIIAALIGALGIIVMG